MWQPHHRMPVYATTSEMIAYTTGYRTGYDHRPRQHNTRWPNAYSKGYWDGFADNPQQKDNPPQCPN